MIWEELLFWGEQLKPISWEEALLLMEAAAEKRIGELGLPYKKERHYWNVMMWRRCDVS